uniref:Uncharacterized protein n=1 Tax=Ditylum brightwellii TaxID=49249 RepID=A0A7S4SI48_9STRA|mmetsp:Transcript_68584/g.101921  ORF Transcript_68584/g.101921 Transcript_68584/m.101921 type:complete len:205 (+) Transcript_68584:101-715(+)
MSDNCDSDKQLTDRIGCILSYAGSTTDISINYSLILANMFLAIRLMTNSRYDRCAAEKILYAILGFTFVVLFQIVLCLIVGCVGVSIIWCAICGWILREEKFLSSEQITTTTTRPAPNNDTSCGAVTSSPPIVATEQSKLNLLSIVLSMDLSAIIYYSIVEEPITTLAHILAIIMGICISYVGERFFYPTVSSESTIPLIGNRN